MIEIYHVDKWYGPAFQALKDCTTSVAKGEVVVVCGPSGSGKSTLIKCVNALEPFQNGEIILDGIRVNDPKTDLPKLRSRIGIRLPPTGLPVEPELDGPARRRLRDVSGTLWLYAAIAVIACTIAWWLGGR